MDVEKAFHMTGGVGKTSYAKNSSLQVLSFFLFFLSSQSTIYNIFPHHFLVLVYNWILCVYTYIPYLILLFQQKKESDKVKHIIIQTVEELYLATTPKSIGIADLGCSSGPNTLSIIKDIFQAIQGTSQRIMHHSTEFRVYFNDLPTNDFNSIFKALPEFQKLLRQDRKNGFPSIFMGGYPGSFYGRLFPNSYLHFVHSSYSLHWLSRV